ncbi:MAG: acetolactate synthase small subunit [Gammaproteobacteria bacterium]|nr:acetolactate synthase small subunit [Gammaproteobacteria bacterium]
MRHIISIVLQNEAGALARVANLFSSRGYNIESLNVAPTNDETVSRLTLVTTGSNEVIDQITKQLGKLIDVVRITDMTSLDHIERELALLKLKVDSDDGREAVARVVEQFDAKLLDDRSDHLTVELVGGSRDIDRFLERASRAARVVTVVRSGAMAISRGAPQVTR